ncbi:DUF1491 family protein [Tepidamorphus sp. 3E244]|uniref:DUF1491 family protein n=1 Tax=Tepidamorphus sp. 3E244 TaxID=3385498 RepID=UPI0038FCE766
MRLRSDLWVAAYIRKVNGDGAFAVLQRRGAAEAGAIWIAVEDGARRHHLFTPAPQTLTGDTLDRVFERRSPEEGLDGLQLAEAIARETRFDSDLWVVAVDDGEGRHFLENVVEA